MIRVIENVRTLLLLAVVVLLNMAATTLFFRADLTEKDVHTLSSVSRDVVATLQEPLTVRAFFSPNLPAPYSNIEQQTRDLLQEYALAGNRFFNYTFYSMEPPEGERSEVLNYENLARSYRIFPVQIQDIDRDEVKLVNAYMGLAFIHGDLIETIPAITSTDGLELQITDAIRRLNDRVSALLALEEDIQVTLYYSSSLSELGGDLEGVPQELEELVDSLDDRYYGRLAFTARDPDAEPEAAEEARSFNMPSFRLREPDGSTRTVWAGLAVRMGEEVYGSQVAVYDLGGLRVLNDQEIEGAIEDSVKGLIGIYEEIAYMADYGTPPYRGTQRAMDAIQTDLSTFYNLAVQKYDFRGVSVAANPIPESIRTLLVVSPREPLSDYALFQIDQFLMRGNSLILLLDAFDVVVPGRSQGQSFNRPIYQPRNTGLEQLMSHYGVDLEQAFVLDEKSYVQMERTPAGGLVEQPIYFVPLIGQEGMNQDLPMVTDLGEVLVPNVSPLTVSTEHAGVEIHPVFTTSPRSWLVDDVNMMSELLMEGPPSESGLSSYTLAYLLEGSFPSYFADRPIPEAPRDEDADAAVTTTAEQLAAETPFVPESRGGRIFVMGTSSLLGSNVLDPDGRTANSMFVLNLIDTMNGREDLAVMRNKGAMIQPLPDTDARTRTWIKTLNIAGLPVLVAVLGLLVWLGRNARSRRIKAAFEAERKSA